jgi:hypothetical protein
MWKGAGVRNSRMLIHSLVVVWEGGDGELLWRWRRFVSGGTGEGVLRGSGDGGNRPMGHGGLPSTTLFGGNRRVDGPWRVGFLVLLGSWCRAGRERASRAGQGMAEIDRGGMVECPSPLCLHFSP